MRWRQKLFIFSVASAAVVMGLLLTGVLAAHLLANREAVRSLITSRAAQAIGGELSYDRLTVGFFPLPHLQAEGIDLHKQQSVDVRAAELSVYLKLWPLLAGRVSIRRLVLEAPDIRIAVGSQSTGGKKPVPSPSAPPLPLEKTLQAAIGGFFGAMATVEPGTDVLIQRGRVTLAFDDAPDLSVTGIDLYGENDGGKLSLSLECRSKLTGRLELGLQADSAAVHASGRIFVDSLNLRPILHHASLPGGILTEDTQARVETSFTIDGPEKVSSRFSLVLPKLTAMRRDLKLNLESAFISGGLTLGAEGVALAVDTLRSVRPAIDLSAGARILPDRKTGRSVIELHAAARQLDVAVASQVTQAIAGDLEEIRPAFAVAKAGILTDAAYHVRFEPAGDGYRLAGMNASGHLSAGRVTIPGIDADLERMDGDVEYEDSHVAFKDVSGHFKGIAFEKLDAAIDWETESTLSIASTAVHVEAKPFSDWLFSFEDLSGVREYITAIDGTAWLSLLNIDGPLTDPARWDFKIRGTPESILLTSPFFPFEARISGGEIVHVPGSEEANDLAIEFLDGAVVASYQSKGIIDPESIMGRLDGSLGPEAIAWVTTMLPIPEHLQLKPPVDLSGLRIAWSYTGGTAFEGTVNTAGGVELFADVRIFPQTWDIRRIKFSDGLSRIVVSARKEAQQIEITCAGNVEKATADRLLADNRILGGRLEGDFHAIIDTRRPLDSAFAGRLSGQDLRFIQLLPEPVEVKRISVTGSAGRLAIDPSEIHLYGSRLVVDGILRNRSGDVTLDLDVTADRLDAELIQALQSMGPKEAAPSNRDQTASAPTVRGSVRILTDEFAYGKWIWSPVAADLQIDGDTIRVRIDEANLCGIDTTGELEFSPRGTSLHITPRAEGASLQATAGCLWHKPVQAEARYDLAGAIQLPATPQDPTQRMTGRLDLSSKNGRIFYAGALMKIFAFLNVTEAFTGGATDLSEKGYGYTDAHVKTRIEGGKLFLDQILLDGHSLKLTGRGGIDLKNQQVDIELLAAPLKTVDRVVNKIPVIRYIAGGSLISIPLRVTGKLDNVQIAAMSASDVGKGLLDLMGRTLKAPFKLVEEAASLTRGNAAKEKQPPAETRSPDN